MQNPLKKITNHEERLSWIRLSRSENIGPATFFRLLDIFPDTKTALEKTPDLANRMRCPKQIKICAKSVVEKELEQIKKFGGEIVLFGDDDYPRLVREIHDPAPMLTLYGRKELLQGDIIGVVGPRNATFQGCRFAEKLGEDLGKGGVVVASGLARGVDAAAHRGAIKHDTIAVIGGGLSNIYPSENEELYKKIYENGLIISEYPFAAKPRGSNFVQRNRIISGISYAIVVVEAGIQSGSLVTARFALEQGREVFAVPGSPLDPRCFGSNSLLEDGAIFTQSAARVLREIPSLRARFSQAGMLGEPEAPDFIAPPFKMPSDADIDKVRLEIEERIGFSAISIEEIISEMSVPARLVNIALVQLELAEKIEINLGRVVKK